MTINVTINALAVTINGYNVSLLHGGCDAVKSATLSPTHHSGISVLCLLAASATLALQVTSPVYRRSGLVSTQHKQLSLGLV